MLAHSLYAWIKLYSKPEERRQQSADQYSELRKLRTELKRVTTSEVIFSVKFRYSITLNADTTELCS